jgi:lysozyme family protein
MNGSATRRTRFTRSICAFGMEYNVTQFDTLLPLILKHEGVSSTNPTAYANDPNDPGGETKFGISQREWSLLRVKPQFANFPAATRDLTQDQATAIYHSIYYVQPFDELPPGPALIAFDCNVNEGIGVKILQRAIGVNDDGQWGPLSENALRYALRNVPGLTEELLWQRIAHYVSISKPSPVNQAYLAKEWLPRLQQCRAEARTL